MRKRNPDDKIRELDRRGNDPVRELLEKERAGIISVSAVKAAAVVGNEIAMQLHEDLRFSQSGTSIKLLSDLFFFILLNDSPGTIKLAFKLSWHSFKQLTQNSNNIEIDYPNDSISYIENWLTSNYLDMQEWIENNFSEDDLEYINKLVNGECHLYTESVFNYINENAADLDTAELARIEKSDALIGFLNAFRKITQIFFLSLTYERKQLILDSVVQDLRLCLLDSVACNLNMSRFWTLKDMPEDAVQAVKDQLKSFGDKIVDSALNL